MTATRVEKAPVAVVGGGPVGLAAAAHLASRGLPFIVLEAGAEPGAAIRQWGHVATFSPWRYMIDSASRALLEPQGWIAPDAEAIPIGHDLVDRYVAPLAGVPAIAPHLRLNARVVAIGRRDFDKVRTKGREAQPFQVHLERGDVIEASAVIDASGTWSRPNPAGSNGFPVPGERELSSHVSYGIPDVAGAARARFAGKRIAVIGSGHSAFNVILDLLKLADEARGTSVTWIMRRENLDSVWGGGASDQLEARGALGQRARAAVESGKLSVRTPFRVRSMRTDAAGLTLTSSDGKEATVDEVIVCAGFRPDLEMLREIRLSLDSWLECSSTLGPLIDPNEHSCGTVRPHGARELAHPEKDFYIVGMKSYGRAPTFLLATGYEQVRSVVAMLAGDVAAAERVELVLPETGVCSTDAITGSGCCGGPAPEGVEACCVQDADAKAAGEDGCGCGDSATAKAVALHVIERKIPS